MTAESKTTLLPKDHFSWSQLNLWETNKAEYIRRYFYGKEGYTTKAMERGKLFATAMEAGESDDDTTELLRSIAVKYDIPEHPIEAMFEGTKLVGFKDTYKPGAFREYKTGKTTWDQDKCDKWGQLKFYALIDVLNGEKIPQCHLDWFPVADGGFTGEMHSFEVKITKKDIKDMEKRVRKAIAEISEEYQKALNTTADITKTDIAGTVLEQYALLDLEIKAIEKKMNELKPEVERTLTAYSDSKVNSNYGSFFFSVRRKWEYPMPVKKMEEELKKEKKIAEETGAATFEETKSLSFRPIIVKE